jgi:hypothetical protein
MNKKIIVITIIIGIVVFFAIAFENRYQLFSLIIYSVTIEEKSELCKTINGKWDNDHNTCDYVEDVQCQIISGNAMCKPYEWQCPGGDPECAVPAMCIPTCSFPTQ